MKQEHKYTIVGIVNYDGDSLNLKLDRRLGVPCEGMNKVEVEAAHEANIEWLMANKQL